jgi:MFS superfamily sulfate permease-like transporter
VMIVFLPGLFRDLPQAALAAVVITAALSLADVPAVVRLWHQRRVECGLSIAAFLGVALLGVLPGILIAVALSILNVFRHAWRPYSTTLGLAEGVPGFHDVRSYPAARRLPGVVIYRFDAPLLFANAKTFRNEVVGLAKTLPSPGWVLVAAEPITDVDTTAGDMLFDLDRLLDERGQTLVFAELKDRVRAKLESYGLTRQIEPEHFFPTLEAAVDSWRAKTGAKWADAP